MGDSWKDPSIPDAEFIARAKQGDTEAFGQLYQRYLTPIYRYIRTRVSTDRDAEDLTENVFLRSLQALDRYKERGAPFGAYLYRVARNMIVDHYRAQPRAEPLEEHASQLGEGADAEGELMEGERVREIRDALLRLPESYQEVIRLRVLMEMPTEEVGHWMKKTPSNVRVLLHRALRAMRKELELDDG